MTWWILAQALAAPCPDEALAFVGLPACVALEVVDADTLRLVNRCAGPVLVDQRARPDAAVVPPGQEVALAALARFTLGAEGALFAVTAVPACEAPKARPATP